MKDIVCVSVDKEIIDYLRKNKGDVKISTVINNILNNYIDFIESRKIKLIPILPLEIL